VDSCIAFLSGSGQSPNSRSQLHVVDKILTLITLHTLNICQLAGGLCVRVHTGAGVSPYKGFLRLLKIPFCFWKEDMLSEK
jgi:hypothetical protein